MRLGFVTCVQLGLEVLDEFLVQGFPVDAIVTLNDDDAVTKSGRVFLDDTAHRHGASLHKTGNVNSQETVKWLGSQELDWLFIIGWSQIARPEVLNLPTKGCLGMHPTLLPTGRGRASIPWAIIKGLEETGVTLFRLAAGVDTGPIVDAVPIPLSAEETSSTLYLKAIEAHRELVARNIDAISTGQVSYRPQDETQATYWPKREPTDGTILPSHTTDEVDRLVRALTPPYPRATWVDPKGRSWELFAGSRDGSLPGLTIPTVDGTYVATVFSSRSGHRDFQADN